MPEDPSLVVLHEKAAAFAGWTMVRGFCQKLCPED